MHSACRHKLGKPCRLEQQQVQQVQQVQVADLLSPTINGGYIIMILVPYRESAIKDG